MKILDVCGLSCPIPVVKTKELVNAGETEFIVITNSNVSKQNVLLFLESHGYNTQVSNDGEEIKIQASK